MAQYTVLARAASGVRLPVSDPLAIASYPTSYGTADILIRTHLVKFEPFSRPLAMGLAAEVRGDAPSLDDAVREFTSTAANLMPVITFAANSATEDLIHELGYDSTPGVTERAFFQQFVHDDAKVVPIERRRVEGSFVRDLISSIGGHPDSERLHRAMAQYHQALKNWGPGSEILALAHLWMACEVLTPVFLREILAAQGHDRRSLAESWGLDERFLDAEVRKRVIFSGNEDTYRRVLRASNGFEHGFMSIPEVHAHASRECRTLADIVRAAIIRAGEFTPEQINMLTRQPFSVPGHIRAAKYLRGMLHGAVEDLAAPEFGHPFMEWRTTVTEVPMPGGDPGDMRLSCVEHITPRLNVALLFSPVSIEVWGGQESAMVIEENAGRSPSADG